MNCRIVRRKAWVDLHTIASDVERRELEAHLNTCAGCRQDWAEKRLLRTSLRALPVRTPPPELTTQLRVIASRHLNEPHQSWFGRMLERGRLNFEDMMRPLAVPFAGGIASAIFLFAMLVPSLAVNLRFTHDIPTGLITDATLKSAAPISFDSGEAVVDVTFDEEGH